MKRKPSRLHHALAGLPCCCRCLPYVLIQTYNSAIIFNPERSVVRGENLDQISCWLTKIPKVEENWTSLIQTLAGQSDWAMAVAFSADGRRITSGSDDETIKVWDVVRSLKAPKSPRSIFNRRRKYETYQENPDLWICVKVAFLCRRHIPCDKSRFLQTWNDSRRANITEMLSPHIV